MNFELKKKKNQRLHVPVDLFGIPVTAEETAQDAHASHPDQLLGHTGVGGTLPLTCERKKASLQFHSRAVLLLENSYMES